MLAKVITLKHSRAGKGFGPVLRYLLRVDRKEQSLSGSNIESGHLQLAYEPYLLASDDAQAYAEDLAALFDEQARECRDRGRFRGNAVYHLAINWREGEHPTGAQAEHTSRHVMRALGFAECQAVWAIHRDTDNDHVHLVINRVHPVKGTAVSVPRGDYFLLDRCMRELELELGCARSEGPYVTVDTAAGPRVVRMSRTERKARGLLQEREGPRLSPKAERAEHNLSADSFQRWISGAPSEALRKAVSEHEATWDAAHKALGAFGCAIEPKGSGLVVRTRLANGRVLAAKASQLGRWASKASLERVLGPYRERSAGLRWADPRKRYEQFLERERSTQDRSEDERMEKRAERAQARRQLSERFGREQLELRAQRSKERALLRQRQERERRLLALSHRKQRQEARSLSRVRQDGGVTLALWAFLAARSREEMQRRHGVQRQALTERLPQAEVWRRWVERQAQAGDQAAQAALRGIRYRDRRRQRLEGVIEGTEVSFRPVMTVGSLRADFDWAQRAIIYRRADGIEAFRDVGPRIVMCERSDASLEGALRVAAQKYGGRVRLMGSDVFQQRAARMATRLGIGVENTELQSVVLEERRRVAERRIEPRAAPALPQPTPHRPGPGRARGLER